MKTEALTRTPRVPSSVVDLARSLLDQYGLKHTVLTLQLQGNLHGGCCGVTARNPSLSAALHGVADVLASCPDELAARQRLQALREQPGSGTPRAL